MKEIKVKARREERKLLDLFLSLRSKDGRTGAKRNACQREKEPRRGRGRGKRIDGQGTCVRWTWVRPGGTSCSPSRLPINQTRPNA